MRKYAVIGTSCSGKTTLVYSAAALLKSRGAFVETIVGSDRHLPFARQYLETKPTAQAYVISQLMKLECERSLTGANVVLGDRSVLDFWAYVPVTFPDWKRSAELRALSECVYGWIRSYAKLFYVPPLPYQDDGTRPPDDFRLKVDQCLTALATSAVFGTSTLVDLTSIPLEERPSYVSETILSP